MPPALLIGSEGIPFPGSSRGTSFLENSAGTAAKASETKVFGLRKHDKSEERGKCDGISARKESDRRE